MSIKRHFFLGDNWLYFKIYTGFKTADLLLKDAIFPLTQYLKQLQIISHWFFIRYNDPDFHIRVRFYLPDIQNNGLIVQQIHNTFQNYFQSGLIWKIQYDTYNREIERYGINTIEISEQIFCADSEMIIELLSNLTDNQQWLWALRSIDELLTVFGYNIEKKYELLNLLKDNFSKEFHIEGGLRKQFSTNFRESRSDIEKIMKTGKDENLLILPILQKSEKIKQSVSDILEYAKLNELQVSLNSLISSHIHMMLNRLFRTQQRKHELILYDYLYRYYDSEIKREKNKDNSNKTE